MAAAEKAHGSSMSGEKVQPFDVWFNLLYSVYSLPNIILPLICGVLIDRVGLRTSMCVLSSFVVAGLCGRSRLSANGESKRGQYESGVCWG